MSKAPQPKRIKQARGDVWRYDYHDAEGRHRPITIGLCRELDKQQACRLLWDELKRREKPAHSLGEFIRTVWLPPRLGQWSHRTQRDMVSVIKNTIACDPLAAMPVTSILKMDVEAFIGRVAAVGYSREIGRHSLVIVKSALEEAVENDWIPRNPARKVKLPAMPGRVPTESFTIDEVRRLVTIPGTDGLMVRVLLFCALRIGELMALLRNDVDLKAATLRIDETIEENGARKETKTKRVRWVPLPPTLAADLRAHMRETDARPSDSALFFGPTRPTANGWHQSDQLNARLRLAAVAVGVAGFTSRRCRATCATLLQGDVADAQAHLGHSKPMMTLLHYKAAIPPRQARAIADLEKRTEPVRVKGRRRKAG